MPKKILIADDDTNIVKLLAARLKANNYDVIAAFDGAQTLRMAHEAKPDLIILDIRMPAGSGISTYEKLIMSSNTALIPVIFITAYANEEIRHKVTELGAEGFITKPFDADELLGMVRHALKEKVDEEPGPRKSPYWVLEEEK
ncbi:MAG: response regulator [Chloroflexi bacterium]|nr:response regulator [Chloroflexota bacterium]